MSNVDLTTEPFLKRCTVCKQEFPATPEYFYIGKTYRNGLKSACKECMKHKSRLRHDYRPYEGKRRDQNKVWTAKYRASHKKEKAERERKFRQDHHDRDYEIHKRYRDTHRDVINAAAQRRRALKLNAIGIHTKDDVQRQYKHQKGKCYWCNIVVGKIYHVDHVIPLTRGGSNGPDNIVIACPHCNMSRSNKLPHEWEGNNGKLL